MRNASLAHTADASRPANNGVPPGPMTPPSPFALRRNPALTTAIASEVKPAQRSVDAALSTATAQVESKLKTDSVPRPTTPTSSTTASTRREDSEHAAFTLAAPGVGWKRTRPATAESGRLSALLRDAFTPTRPKHDSSLFSGRFKQMQRIIAAIEEERAHVVVYGERGSGKTSLANVLAIKAEEAGYFVLRFACSSELTFEDIFRSFLRRLPANLLADGIGATTRAGIDNFEHLLGEHCGVPELVAAFQRLYEKHVILIIDEYDRVTSEDTKAKLAELIKNLSDAAVPVTLLLIGVAENVRDLLGKHPSLQRTLVTVPMPLMSRREIDMIVTTGEEKSGLSFDPWVRQTITDFAQGLPYHAQLLCLFAARSAVRRHSSRVEREDLRYAMQRAAEEAEARTKDDYNLAIGPHDNTSFRDVLFHAARCRSDEFGTFTAADVAAAARPDQQGVDQQGLSLLALQYPLKKLTEPSRGTVLRRIIGPGGLRYQFCSQMMRHHVLVRQAEQRGLI
jgi:Cdc6-like AAA superfamily ATPase